MRTICAQLILAVSLLIGVPLAPVSAAPDWPIPSGVKTVEINGYNMAYQDTGNGVPLVLVHGSLVDYRYWDAQVPEFSKAYRVIAVGLRHHYPEKWNGVGEDFTVRQHALDVAAFIKKLNLGTVHLLGHSRGGPIVMTVARSSPELVRTLILEDANLEALMPETAEKQKRMDDAKARGESVRAKLATGDPEKAAQAFYDSYGMSWEKVPPRSREIVLDNIGTATDTGERGDLSCANIQKFHFPILVLSGERSPKIYSEMRTVMRQCKPDTPEVVIVPNAAHTMHRDNPEFFNKTVLDFLKQH